MGPIEGQRGEPGPRKIGLATSFPTGRCETGVQAHSVSCLHVKFGHEGPWTQFRNLADQL